MVFSVLFTVLEKYYIQHSCTSKYRKIELPNRYMFNIVKNQTRIKLIVSVYFLEIQVSYILICVSTSKVG